MKVCEKHPKFVTCYVERGRSIHLSIYKNAPEEIQLLARAARKFSKLVIL